MQEDMSGTKQVDNTTSVSLTSVLCSILFIIWLSWIDYLIAVHINPHHMSYLNYLVFTTVLTLSLTGGLQLYFWAEQYYLRAPISLKTKLDDFIPFYPIWSWCYIFIHYLVIGMLVIVIESLEQGMYIIFGGIILLVVHCIIFVLLPTETPASYRDFQPTTLSTKFLKYIQGFDKPSNCFPSMHSSIVSYNTFFLLPTFGTGSYILILLIALSCLFTKQHFVIDILPGIFLGWVAYIYINSIIIYA